MFSKKIAKLVELTSVGLKLTFPCQPRNGIGRFLKISGIFGWYN
jgi:hypothetical protein